MSSIKVCFIRYRKIPLLGPGAEPLTLICRTEVDAVTTSANGEEKYMNIKALNEWDLKGGARYVASFRMAVDSLDCSYVPRSYLSFIYRKVNFIF